MASRGNTLEVVGNTGTPKQPSMAIGERLSMCGSFIISKEGDWRPVSEGEKHLSHEQEYAFPPRNPDGSLMRRKRASS